MQLPLSPLEINLLKSIVYLGNNDEYRVQPGAKIELVFLVAMKFNIDQWDSTVTDWFFNPQDKDQLLSAMKTNSNIIAENYLGPDGSSLWNYFSHRSSLWGASIHFSDEIESGHAMAVNMLDIRDYKAADRYVVYTKIKQ